MVIICHRAQSTGTAGVTVPLQLDFGTQTELQKEVAASQALGCKKCLRLLDEVGTCGLVACRRYAVTEEP